MNSENDKNFPNLTLKGYYESFAEKQLEIRDRILNECGVTRDTFYKWKNGETLPPKPSRVIIAKITGIPVETLFPEAD